MLIIELSSLKEEIERLNSDSQNYIYQQSDENIFPLIAEIGGPKNTPYEGGVFLIEINSNEIRFITKICSIFVNIKNGDILNQELIRYDDKTKKSSLSNIINFIKDEILISSNSAEIINEFKSWNGKNIYFEYLKRIKFYTQEYANKDGNKIKVDNNLLFNQDFSKYKNKKEIIHDKRLKRLKNEITKIGNEKIDGLDKLYVCPFNNFKQIYFEMLGPPQTPYEGGVYQFLIDIPQN